MAFSPSDLVAATSADSFEAWPTLSASPSLSFSASPILGMSPPSSADHPNLHASSSANQDAGSAEHQLGTEIPGPRSCGDDPSSASIASTTQQLAAARITDEDGVGGCWATVEDADNAFTAVSMHAALEENAIACMPSADDEEGVLCAICHGNIQPQEAALVCGCDHAFCNVCILNWALQKTKCPV